jgi:hypothetical protein
MNLRRGKGRETIEADGRYQLREPGIFYEPIFTPENSDLRFKNTYFQDDIV